MVPDPFGVRVQVWCGLWVTCRTLFGPAVDHRSAVYLYPRRDRKVHIESDLGSEDATLDELVPQGPLRFVLAVLSSVAETIDAGMDLYIESEFSSEVGLGSSAAVTVATFAALDGMRGITIDKEKIWKRSMQVVRSIQGRASGCDVAASTFGGIVQYRMEPAEVNTLPGYPPLVLVYSGSKLPTAEVISIVEGRRAEELEGFSRLYSRMDEYADMAAKALAEGDWQRLGMIFAENQKGMAEMGLNNPALETIVNRLQEDPGVFGAKISGSGLGDCVVGVGEITSSLAPFQVIPVSIGDQGVRVVQ